MGKEVDRVVTGVAQPVQGADWAPEPQIITPVRSGPLEGWEWASAVRPPYVAGTWQETWSKIIAPLRFPALAWLWVTWHWTRFAATVVVVALVIVLIKSS